MHPKATPGGGRPRLPALCGRLALGALALTLVACATPAPLLQRSQPSGPQWPEAPFAARIEWVKSVAFPEDAGIVKGFWKRALELLAGAEVRPIVKPYGVLYDDGARLLIADPGAGVVHLMDTRQGRYTRIAGDKTARLRSPIGLAEDAENRIYITDSEADAVYRYDPVSQQLTPFLSRLQRPTGIAYNKVNRLLYISETVAHRVIAVDQSGAVKFSFGDTPSEGITSLNLPTDIATDAKGQVYVTDPLNYKIRIFTPEGVEVSEFGVMGDSRGELNKPKGIAVDPEGRIFVSDALLDAVQIFDDTGQFLFSFGSTGTDDGYFWMPSGLFIHEGYIFVADTFNQRVQIFRYLSGETSSSGSAPEPVLTTKRSDR